MKVTIEIYADSDGGVLAAVLDACRAAASAPAAVIPPVEDAVVVPPPPPVDGAAPSVYIPPEYNMALGGGGGTTTGRSLPPIEAAAADRDSDGLPWDGRIHSSSRAKLADGRWRQRRNTDLSIVMAVTAELRAALSAPPAPAAIVPPPPVSAVLPFPFPPIEEPAATSAPAAVPAPPAAMTFPEFMRAITAARLAPGVVLEACKAVGMPSIPALNQRPDLIPTVAAALGVS